MSEPPFTAAECARRLGLTVRALRIYERRGLLAPARTDKGWRVYGPEQVARLAVIAALKSLGLSLAEIGRALEAGLPDLAQLLDARAAAWRRAIEQAQEALRITEGALERLRASETMDVDTLANLIRSFSMNTLPKTMVEAAEALYTEEERERIVSRKLALKDDRTHGAAAWTELLVEVKRLVAEDANPASEAAQNAAARWAALVRAFSGGEAAIDTKARAFWDRALASDPDGRDLPFNRREWDFVMAALRVSAPAPGQTINSTDRL